MELFNGYYVPASCDMRVLALPFKNAHSRDKKVAFDEASHTYYVEGSCDGYISVTKIIEQNFPQFDAKTVAENMVTRRNFKTADKYKKYQIFLFDKDNNERPLVDVVKDICISWEKNAETQRNLGTNIHSFIEYVYNGLSPVKPPNAPEYNYFFEYKKYMEELGFIPYYTEWKLWSKELKLTGMIDMIYTDSSGKFYMRDWKRSKLIDETIFNGQFCVDPKTNKRIYRKMGFGPCAKMPDTNLSHYTIQLNIYKYLLENFYDVPIFDMAIVVFHPNNKTFLEYKIPNVQKIIQTILLKRRKYVSLEQR